MPVSSDPVRFTARVTAVHVTTYLIFGLVASTVLDYRAYWELPELAHMRPIDSPWVASGPALQVLRGLIFAAALYPFRAVFLEGERGALKLWGLLVGVGILSTYGPSPGSVEGVIYTRSPLPLHLFGMPEVIGQAGAFAAALVGWYRHPSRAWGLVFGIGAGLAVAVSLAGVFLAPLAAQGG